METCEDLEDFSLLGGPLYRLGCRLGLVRGTNTVPLGMLLGAFPWIVLLAQALFEGFGHLLFSEMVRRFRRSYRQPTCGFKSLLASFAFQSICSQKSFRIRS
jgi:hypothetical protein